HGEAGTLGRQLAAARHGGRIAVDRVYVTRAGAQDRPAVAAGAEGGVEVGAAGPHGERGEHLVEQHGQMPVAPWRRPLLPVRRSQREVTLPRDDFQRLVALKQDRSTSTLLPPALVGFRL